MVDLTASEIAEYDQRLAATKLNLRVFEEAYQSHTTTEPEALAVVGLSQALLAYCNKDSLAEMLAVAIKKLHDNTQTNPANSTNPITYKNS